jgi:hypothetical protein
MVERWAQLDDEKGKEFLDKLVSQLQSGFVMNEDI